MIRKCGSGRCVLLFYAGKAEHHLYLICNLVPMLGKRHIKTAYTYLHTYVGKYLDCLDCLLWAVFLIAEKAYILRQIFSTEKVVFFTKMGWLHFWRFFSQTYLVTPVGENVVFATISFQPNQPTN
jgi:hypothetical protein